MSDRFTSISLPGLWGGGIADRGRQDVAEMVRQLRQYAEQQVATFSEILAASDKDFRVETYVGAWVERNKEVLQQGRPNPLPNPDNQMPGGRVK